MSYISFKYQYSLKDRIFESNRVLEKYPTKIPIICERSNHPGSNCPLIDKNKYLVERDLTLGQFQYVIRKRLKLTPEKAIFLIIKNNIPATTQIIGDLYEKNKNEDGFLYINYSYENVFGN